jgi:hypothetical protein
MKSTRQRRTEIKVQRAGKRELTMQDAAQAFQASRAAADRAHELQRDRQRLTVSKQAWVNPANLRPTNSHGTPEFVARGDYTNQAFTCKTCGAQEVWPATQQKWWYEAARGDVWTTAVLCKPCRRKEQARQREARQVHLAGWVRRPTAPSPEH